MTSLIDVLFAQSAGGLVAPDLLTPLGDEVDLVVTFTASETNGADTPVVINLEPVAGVGGYIFYQGVIPAGGTLQIPSVVVPPGGRLSAGVTSGTYDLVGTGWRHIPS